MEKQTIDNRPMGGRYDGVQYALAVAAIWGAVGFGLWAQAQPLVDTNPMLLALQPVGGRCDPS